MGRPRQATLLERLGGEPMLINIIKGWYRRIFKDEELKHFFRNMDMKKITSHQYEFL
jgi:truncated hemoglobin YjbI